MTSTPCSGSHQSAPTDQSPPVGRGKLLPELNAVLTGCAVITKRADGSASIIPCQFIGLSDASGVLKADLPRFHHAVGDTHV